MDLSSLDVVALPLALALCAGAAWARRRELRAALPPVGRRAWIALALVVAASVALRLAAFPLEPRPGRVNDATSFLNAASAGFGSGSHRSSAFVILLRLGGLVAPPAFALGAAINTALSALTAAVVFLLALLWSRAAGASVAAAALYAFAPVILRNGASCDYHVVGDLLFLAGACSLFLLLEAPGRLLLFGAAGGLALAVLGNTELLVAAPLFALVAWLPLRRAPALRARHWAAAAALVAALVAHRGLFFLHMFGRPELEAPDDTIAGQFVQGGPWRMLGALGHWGARQVPQALRELSASADFPPAAALLALPGLVVLWRAGRRPAAAFAAAGLAALLVVYQTTHNVALDGMGFTLTLHHALLAAASAAALARLPALMRGPLGDGLVAVAAAATAAVCWVGVRELRSHDDVGEPIAVETAGRWLAQAPEAVFVAPAKSWVRYVRPHARWAELGADFSLPALEPGQGARIVVTGKDAAGDKEEAIGERLPAAMEVVAAALRAQGRSQRVAGCIPGGLGRGPLACLVEAGPVGSGDLAPPVPLPVPPASARPFPAPEPVLPGR